MDFENGKFLLDIYKNYKDLQHFFLDNDYQQSLISFFNILKPLIPIKNIAAFFLKNKQDKDFFFLCLSNRRLSVIRIHSYSS